MAQPARYLFDLDFSAPPEPEIEEVVEEIIEEEPPEPMITVAEHEQLIETIRQQAYQQGLEEGRQEREKNATEQSIDLQKSILDEIAMVYTEVGSLLARLERDACKLAFRFASRFAEKLVAQEPKEEIQALLNQVLAPLRKSPHLTIRVHSDLADAIDQSVKNQMEQIGFAGKLVIAGEESIAPGDCEIEWNDGGIGRNMRTAIHQAEELLEQHFAHLPDDEQEAENEEQDELPQDSAPQDQAPNEQEPGEQDPASETDTDMTSDSNEETDTETDPNQSDPHLSVPPSTPDQDPMATSDNHADDPLSNTDTMVQNQNQPQQPQGEPQ